MNKNEIIENISRQLEEIVNYEISKQSESESNQAFKDKYENLVDEIDYLLNEARGLVENLKDENLNLGHIEAEGYLRAMLTISNLVR